MFNLCMNFVPFSAELSCKIFLMSWLISAAIFLISLSNYPNKNLKQQRYTQIRGILLGMYHIPSKNIEDTFKNASKIANLISKLNFYKLIPYPMDNSLSGRRRPTRQTSEKYVLCLHRQVGP